MYCNETEPGKTHKEGLVVFVATGFSAVFLFSAVFVITMHLIFFIGEVVVNAQLMFKIKRLKVFTFDVVSVWWGKGFL